MQQSDAFSTVQPTGALGKNKLVLSTELEQWNGDTQNKIGAGTVDTEASYSFEEASDDSGQLESIKQDELVVPNQFSQDDGDRQVILEDTFLIYGKPARVQLTPSCVVIHTMEVNRKLQNLVLPAAGGPLTFVVPIDDVISTNILTLHGPCTSARIAGFSVLTYRKGRSNPADWTPLVLELESDKISTAGKWVQYLNRLIQQIPDRPKHLLVIINPYGGSKRAREVWTDSVEPILRQAGVAYYSFETQYSGHAREYMESISRSELLRYDGVIGVGGDGLFQELINGLLLRHRDILSRPPEVGPRLRLCQIPGGSTDAVACSTNGTRSAVAATLHVVLGDRMPVDVMKVESLDGSISRYATCMASYGFMGDLMRKSEGMRWMGPVRYDVAGAVTYLAASSYAASISYRRAAPVPNGLDTQPCKAGCELCSSARSSEIDSQSNTCSHSHVDLQQSDHTGKDQSEAAPPTSQRRGLLSLARFGGGGTSAAGKSPSSREQGVLRAMNDAFSLDEQDAVLPTRSNSRLGWSFSLQKVDEHAAEGDPHHQHTHIQEPTSLSVSVRPMESQAESREAASGGAKDTGAAPVAGPAAGSNPAGVTLQLGASGNHVDDVTSDGEEGGDAWDTQDLPSTARARMLQDAVMFIRQGSGSQWAASGGGGGQLPGSFGASAGPSSSTAPGGHLAPKVSPQSETEPRVSSHQMGVRASAYSSVPRSSDSGAADSEQQPQADSRSSGSGEAAVAGVGTPRVRGAEVSTESQVVAEEGTCAAVPHKVSEPPAGEAADKGESSRENSGEVELAIDEADDDGEHVVQVQQLQQAVYRPYMRARALSKSSLSQSYVSTTNEPVEKLDGDFQALMCAVSPCRSDKSKGGVIPYAHLADGRLHLVLVKKCSRVQFLRFLMHMSGHGVDNSTFEYVDVKHVTEFTVQPNGKESTWNVDGELVSNCGLRVLACRGLVDVFSRGVDM